MDRIAYATRALFWQLRKDLPARLTAAAPTPPAPIIVPPGPYTIAVGETGLELQGQAITLTAGAARTAAQVAGEINAAVPGLAVTDAEGGLVLTDSDAPTAEAPGYIKVGDGTANDVFGFRKGASDACCIAISDPAPVVLQRPLYLAEDLDGPVLFLERDLREACQVPLGLEAANVTIPLGLIIPGHHGQAEATHAAAAALAEEIANVLRAGDGRAEYLIGGDTYGEAIEKAEPGQIAVAVSQRGPKGSRVPYGIAQVPIEVRLYADL